MVDYAYVFCPAFVHPFLSNKRKLNVYCYFYRYPEVLNVIISKDPSLFFSKLFLLTTSGVTTGKKNAKRVFLSSDSL